MKYSKIVLGGLLAITIFGISCENKSANQPNSTGVVSTSSSGGIGSNIVTIPAANSTPKPGLGLIATPRPDSTIEDQSPKEPAPFNTSAPFIIGKSAVPFGGGTGLGSASAEPPEIIVASKVSGKVWGYNISSKSYSPVANAEVIVGASSMITDSAGYYTTSDIISDASDISASANGYLTSTVSKVSPGDNRDIHLQPLDNSPRFNTNTISLDYISLDGSNPAPIDVSTAAGTTTTTTTTRSFPSILSFSDNNNTRFINTLLNSTTGRYRLEVNPVANQTTAQGQLLVYDIERDSLGRATNPTQIKSFILKRDIVFRVGDTSFPTSTGDITSNNFVKINANFHDPNLFSDFVCNAFVVFPTGEKLLVSKYTGGVPTNLSFRLPQFVGISNVSYTLEAHSGSASRGSDVVINDLHAGDSVEAYLMEPPSGLTPDYNSTGTGSSPSFSWKGTGDSRGYQVEVQSTSGLVSQAWEGFSKETTINYPALSPLKLGAQYRYQVIDMDFSFSRLSVLNNKAEELSSRAFRNSRDLPFKVQLVNHNTNSLPKGYRVSYDTVLFRAR